MTIENPEKVIKFPKRKRINPETDHQALKEVIKETLPPLKDLKLGQRVNDKEFIKKTIEARPDFEVARGGKK